MADRPEAGLLDTSVVLDLQLLDAAALPRRVADRHRQRPVLLTRHPHDFIGLDELVVVITV